MSSSMFKYKNVKMSMLTDVSGGHIDISSIGQYMHFYFISGFQSLWSGCV